MSGRKYYCYCDSNCKFETMTKEQILAAIAQAAAGGEQVVLVDSETGMKYGLYVSNGKLMMQDNASGATGGGLVFDKDAAFITKVKEKNAGGMVTFWVGTTQQYNALQEIDPYCVYIKTDDKTISIIHQAIEDAYNHADDAMTVAQDANEKSASAQSRAQSAIEKAESAWNHAHSAVTDAGEALEKIAILEDAIANHSHQNNGFGYEDTTGDGTSDVTLPLDADGVYIVTAYHASYKFQTVYVDAKYLQFMTFRENLVQGYQSFRYDLTNESHPYQLCVTIDNNQKTIRFQTTKQSLTTSTEEMKIRTIRFYK